MKKINKTIFLGIFLVIFLNNTFAVQIDNNYQAMHDVFGIYDQNNTGDVNISFKVRSCNDALCNGESFVGANGTTSGWFTTDFNNNNISWDLNGIAINRYFQYTVRIVSADKNYTGKLFDTNVTYLNANSIVENGIKIGYPNNPLLTITSSGTAIAGFLTIGNRTDANTGLTTGDLNISHNLFVDGNSYATAHIDRTPAWTGTTKEALNAIINISAIGTEINHNSLPDFAKATIPYYEKKQIGENCKGVFSPKITGFCEPAYDYFLVPEKSQPARDLGAMVTLQTEAIKELENEITKISISGKIG
jgi:hypothetical protein